MPTLTKLSLVRMDETFPLDYVSVLSMLHPSRRLQPLEPGPVSSRCKVRITNNHKDAMLTIWSFTKATLAPARLTILCSGAKTCSLSGTHTTTVEAPLTHRTQACSKRTYRRKQIAELDISRFWTTARPVPGLFCSGRT